ncbi:MAG: hypothetical protein CNE89_13855 [Sphingomonadaceae bacterium MED-G03]|jgi:hypothetical protein|nr:MAG: hypothetical protein CNE89_13855 [Sphingomonadaceae bacterium MED-G03]
MKAIASYDDIGQLKKLMANAKRLNQEDVYLEALARRCELEGIDFDDPVEREFHGVLVAYEEFLKERNGRTTSASYTRRKLRDKGVIRCLEDWALAEQETDGFKALMSKRLTHLTGEHIVLKYPDRFSPEAVEGARRRLSKHGAI